MNYKVFLTKQECLI